MYAVTLKECNDYVLLYAHLARYCMLKAIEGTADTVNNG